MHRVIAAAGFALGRPSARLAEPSAGACDGRAAPAPDMSEPEGSKTLGIATAPSAGCNARREAAGSARAAYRRPTCLRSVSLLQADCP